MATELLGLPFNPVCAWLEQLEKREDLGAPTQALETQRPHFGTFPT